MGWGGGGGGGGVKNQPHIKTALDAIPTENGRSGDHVARVEDAVLLLLFI